MLKFIVLFFSEVHRLKFSPTDKNTNTFHSSHKNCEFLGLLTVQKSKKANIKASIIRYLHFFVSAEPPKAKAHTPNMQHIK